MKPGSKFIALLGKPDLPACLLACLPVWENCNCQEGTQVALSNALLRVTIFEKKIGRFSFKQALLSFLPHGLRLCARYPVPLEEWQKAAYS